MASLPEHSRIARFGIFEVDLPARELRKAGLKIRLHDQPFQVLGALLERPGEVIRRSNWRDAHLGARLRTLEPLTGEARISALCKHFAATLGDASP